MICACYYCWRWVINQWIKIDIQFNPKRLQGHMCSNILRGSEKSNKENEITRNMEAYFFEQASLCLGFPLSLASLWPATFHLCIRKTDHPPRLSLRMQESKVVVHVLATLRGISHIGDTAVGGIAHIGWMKIAVVSAVKDWLMLGVTVWNYWRG